MSDQQQENWPTIESQESYWRTKEADLSLDKVEATTDYIDHWAEPEWTLRDEVGESFKEIP